jgi:hypothetical protein
MNDLLDLLDSWNFNDLFNDLFDWDNLWDFNNLFNDFFDDFFDFNDLGNNSEDLKDIINTDDSHDFLVDHSDDSFVDFEGDSSSNLDFFQLLQECFDQNSQVEFDSSAFFAAVRVNIFNSDSLRNKLDDFDKSVEFINFHNINDFLLEKFD